MTRRFLPAEARAELKILLCHLDGKLPNIALMRLSAHFKALGHRVELRRGNPVRPIDDMLDPPSRVYGSCIFEKSRRVANDLIAAHPGAIVGGTGYGFQTLEDIGITTLEQDYSIYPVFQDSIGFSQRGCRLKCGFCVVPKKEGAIRDEQSIGAIWRGEPFPRNILLLDNDFFGQESWREKILEAREGRFKLCFSQGINARFLNEESAAAIASIDYRDDSFSTKRIYTAWDNAKDESRLFRGLIALRDAGVKPDHIMVYMLIGYWPGETFEDVEFRRRRLREFGARPYPMPFVRTPESVGYQRFVLGAYDKRFSWHDWSANKWRPEGLINPEAQPRFEVFQ